MVEAGIIGDLAAMKLKPILLNSGTVGSDVTAGPIIVASNTLKLYRENKMPPSKPEASARFSELIDKIQHTELTRAEKIEYEKFSDDYQERESQFYHYHNRENFGF